MKPLSLFVSLLLSFALLSGCSKKAPPITEPSQPGQLEPEQPAEPELPMEEVPVAPMEGERIVLAEAESFRGTVTKVEEKDGHTLVTLAQAEGSGYPNKETTVLLSDDTRYSFEREKLAEGEFIEVYYHNKEDALHAAAINHFVSTDLTVYNGVVVEVKKDEEKPGEGSILMRNFQGENEYLFHIFADTHMVVPLDSIQAEDRLHVFHSPVSTRSLPPQSSAYEVRPYKE